MVLSNTLALPKSKEKLSVSWLSCAGENKARSFEVLKYAVNNAVTRFKFKVLG
jgi:hypothetical protein